MENDEYNEILFRNIVECNVEYPSEFVSPVAKDLLCKILVKDMRKRITIEEIKLHNNINANNNKHYNMSKLINNSSTEYRMRVKKTNISEKKFII